jgi:hypothetical protein
VPTNNPNARRKHKPGERLHGPPHVLDLPLGAAPLTPVCPRQ